MSTSSPKDWSSLVDPEKDCLPATVSAEVHEEDHQADWRVVGVAAASTGEWPWSARPRVGGRSGLAWLERVALVLEGVVNRLIGAPTLNPFYHTGTIAVCLLILVAVTGLYLTLFYILPGFGTSVAYDAVAAIDGHWVSIGRIMRGVHRYASGAAVVATLLHALRTFFQDRFRGARWLAWLTGMLLLAVLWFEGLTGYWLIWDERAQLILETVIRALNTFPSVGVPFALSFLSNEATDQAWAFFLILLFVHLALFAITGLFYWLHVLRLSRAKFLPPRYFMIALGVILAIAALARPATSVREADLGRLPGPMTFDVFFLFYLPATLRTSPSVFWGTTLGVFAFVSALPWLFKGKAPGKVVIDKDVCTGCTNCANDCPYSAIQMLPRTDGKPHKLIAVENPDLCVSCGICVGSCDGLAVSLTDLPATDYYRSILTRVRSAKARSGGSVTVMLTCERHGAHSPKTGPLRGAKRSSRKDEGGPGWTEVVVVPCVGVLHPNLVAQVLEAGAAEVAIVGCPLDDCAQREGNQWTEARLNRTRLPRLKKQYVDSPIHLAWLPPDESVRALRLQPSTPARPACMPPGARGTGGKSTGLQRLKPIHFVRGGLVLALVLAFQVAITEVPYRPYEPQESLLQLGMRNNGQLRQNTRVLTGPELAELSHEEQVNYLEEQQAEGRFPTRLQLEIDGQVVLDKDYRALGFHEEGSSFALEKFFLPPGEHHVRLSVDDAGGELTPVVDEQVFFAAGQIHAITFDRVMERFELK